MFNVLLGLEAVLIGDEGDGVGQAIGTNVLVAAGHFKSLVVFAQLFQSSLLLARCTVASLKTVERVRIIRYKFLYDNLIFRSLFYVC